MSPELMRPAKKKRKELRMNQKHISGGCALFVAALVLGGQVEAQERTAGGPLQQQMSWNALSSQIE